MPEATITIAEIQPPAQGKKMFTAFDTQGGRWQIWPDKSHLYAAGRTYTIEYQSSNFKGTTYNTITKQLGAQGVSGGGQLTPMAAQHPGPAQIRPPAPAQADDRGEDIFVCGAINNILANPSVNPLLLNEEELKGTVLMLRRVWAATKRGQRGRDDMNDEIPL